MTDAGFTKGPWEIYTGETFGNGPNDWNPIAVYADIHTKRTTIATFRVNYPHGDQQQRDNARLIAAAPDLFEALKGIVDDDDAGVSLADQRARSDARMAAAKAAILKATGA